MMRARRLLLTVALLPVLGLRFLAQATPPESAYETTIDGYILSRGLDVTVDPDGNAYVIGSWYADQQRLDILVVKLDPEDDPLWVKPIIGYGHDYATGLALDDAGDLFVTGWTDSDDFPTTADALYPEQVHFRDAFLMKLARDDGRILYSTYLGGDYTDEAWGIALNDAGEIYLVGMTGSTDFPTVDPLQAELNGWPYAFTDLFVTKIPADGSALEFSTYLGGENAETLGGLTLDPTGHLYVTGSTRSIHFPTTEDAFQEEFVGEILGCEVPFGADYNCEDMFLTKLAPDGSLLAYSTYIGGTSPDFARGVAVDADGCAHVVGYSASDDSPRTASTRPRRSSSRR